MAKCVAASIKWAWVEVGKLAHVFWRLCARNLGTTLGIRNLSRHGRRSFADTDDRIFEDVLASGPSPSLLIEAIDVFLRKTIGHGDR